MLNEHRIEMLLPILCVLLGIASALAYFLALPPQIPIFYSLTRPQDQLAPSYAIFLLPGLSFVIWMCSLFFKRFQKANDVSLYLFHLGSALLIALLFIALIRIVAIVN